MICGRAAGIRDLIHPKKKGDHRGWPRDIPNTNDNVPRMAMFACRGWPRSVHVSDRAKLGVAFARERATYTSRDNRI